MPNKNKTHEVIFMMESLKTYRQNRLSDKFIDLLVSQVHLSMIELGRKKGSHFINSKLFQKELEAKIDLLLPHFTYKEWVLILKNKGPFQKNTKNKEENIRKNLYAFLKNHYRIVYHSFRMDLYDQFQKREASTIATIILAEDVIIHSKKRTAVVIYYKGGDRIAYCPELKERVVIENIKILEQSVLITLVDIKQEKGNRWLNQMLNFFSS